MDRENVELTEKRSGHRTWLYVLAFMLTTAALFGLYKFGMYVTEATAPLKASDAFVYAILENRADDAYKLTDDSFKKATNLKTLEGVASTASQNLKKDTLKATQGNIENGPNGSKLTTLKYDIEGSDGKYQMTVKLSRAKGQKQWLIAAVDNAPKK